MTITRMLIQLVGGPRDGWQYDSDDGRIESNVQARGIFLSTDDGAFGKDFLQSAPNGIRLLAELGEQAPPVNMHKYKIIVRTEGIGLVSIIAEYVGPDD